MAESAERQAVAGPAESADGRTAAGPAAAGAPPRGAGWRHIGPGIVVAATGVGAGDLVATLIAGSRFGYTLLWAAVIGCLVKISLAEAAGRWHLATGRTLFDGWRSLGPWTSVYFIGYVAIWGFVYGAAAMSSSALPLGALFPDVMDLRWWGVLCGLVGLVFVWFNRYAVFEKVMTVLVGVMFVVTVYLAVRVAPHLGPALAGLVPVLPDGSLVYTLGLIGGVGGTITLAAYGYWVNAKGWTDAGWMRVMRLDNRVAYVTTGVFVVAMLFVGAELLHSSGVALAKGDRGLLSLSDILAERYGTATAKLFLVGFFATSFTSLIGVWQGVSLMFADFVANFRARAAAGTPDLDLDLAPATAPVAGDPRSATAPAVEGPVAGDPGRPDPVMAGAAGPAADHPGSGPGPDGGVAVASGARERSLPFRAYLLWLTFPPISLLFLDEPFGLVIVYGVIGAFFMPFLALTLVWLLNSSRTPREWRNGWLSNGMLVLAGVLFVVLCVQQVRELPW
ncbi:Nramp family divalent metal transporter [Streptomyces sp. LP05-1]|uniref:Nramp family divalent metal transporter n=1 Tax=Streptomyces pyxinae TaxID=2970734 RepID=A0ABT2CAV0_9ACTN|nr:Nramp family divalent metal transporter [Streptomyces sp. LP05-1]MCS0634527.1 Nramp family divalent metal transporter [Streptomyces sp. LP05-1]